MISALTRLASALKKSFAPSPQPRFRTLLQAGSVSDSQHDAFQQQAIKLAAQVREFNAQVIARRDALGFSPSRRSDPSTNASASRAQ